MSGLTVHLFPDNQNVTNIVFCGSHGTSMYNVSCHHSISMKLNGFLGPRVTAWSFLCPIYDPDDWGLSWDIFLKTDLLWGASFHRSFLQITLIQKSPDLILDFGVPVQKASMHLLWIGAGGIVYSPSSFTYVQLQSSGNTPYPPFVFISVWLMIRGQHNVLRALWRIV